MAGFWKSKGIAAGIIVAFVAGFVSGNPQNVHAGEFQENLYAQAAVLMDGDSGRVLYGKEESSQLPMASTTKVMTCIVALENSESLNEVVEVSAKAASQPEVKLHIQKGERYRLKDLLYSLMLKSHNDSAVAIAEGVAGSVEAFAALMNEKARQLGCEQTHFVTPNGLDASDEGGAHSTTARELALIMRYAIGNEQFLKITQTMDYSFTDLSGNRSFSVHNANTLLGNMEGMLSGKTGFTGAAGYCYVCAVKRDKRVFIVTLLACGWPNNKTYKWEDTRKLIAYGCKNYHYQKLNVQSTLGAMEIKKGIPVSRHLFETAYSNVQVLESKEGRTAILMRDDEELKLTAKLPEELSAPVKKGQEIGVLEYQLNNEVISRYPVILKNTIEEIDFSWYLETLAEDYFFLL